MTRHRPLSDRSKLCILCIHKVQRRKDLADPQPTKSLFSDQKNDATSDGDFISVTNHPREDGSNQRLPSMGIRIIRNSSSDASTRTLARHSFNPSRLAASPCVNQIDMATTGFLFQSACPSSSPYCRQIYTSTALHDQFTMN